jgi:hypothetical protein
LQKMWFFMIFHDFWSPHDILINSTVGTKVHHVLFFLWCVWLQKKYFYLVVPPRKNFFSCQ